MNRQTVISFIAGILATIIITGTGLVEFHWPPNEAAAIAQPQEETWSVSYIVDADYVAKTIDSLPVNCRFEIFQYERAFETGYSYELWDVYTACPEGD